MDKKSNFYLYIAIVTIICFSILMIRKIILKNRLLTKEKFDFSNDIVNMKTLDNFNNKFNTGVVKLPVDTILIGIEDTTVYEYYDVQGWNY